MKLIEKYPRPCFATCECGDHGKIVFLDGTTSEAIDSVETGKRVIKDAHENDLLSDEDELRVTDHLVCSDLPDKVMYTIVKISSAPSFHNN